MNPNKRYQKDYNLGHFYPKIKGVCACGCSKKLTGRQTKWASRECNDKVYLEFAILKGNTDIIRKELFNTEQGYCRNCGVHDKEWQADHILPVFKGGGACGMDNFQTLCLDCHHEKTNYQRDSHRKANSSHASLSSLTFLL